MIDIQRQWYFAGPAYVYRCSLLTIATAFGHTKQKFEFRTAALFSGSPQDAAVTGGFRKVT